MTTSGRNRAAELPLASRPMRDGRAPVDRRTILSGCHRRRMSVCPRRRRTGCRAPEASFHSWDYRQPWTCDPTGVEAVHTLTELEGRHTIQPERCLGNAAGHSHRTRRRPTAFVSRTRSSAAATSCQATCLTLGPTAHFCQSALTFGGAQITLTHSHSSSSAESPWGRICLRPEGQRTVTLPARRDSHG